MNAAEKFLAMVGMTGAAFCAGLIIGHSRPQQATPPEAPRPAVVHASGAITMARVTEPPPLPLDMAPGTEARTRAIVLELEPIATRRELQIDLQEGKDGTRVTVSGQGIIGGRDFTIPRPEAPVQKWTVGITHDGRTPGIWGELQQNRWVIGVAASQNHAMVMAGIRF